MKSLNTWTRNLTVGVAVVVASTQVKGQGGPYPTPMVSPVPMEAPMGAPMPMGEMGGYEMPMGYADGGYSGGMLPGVDLDAMNTRTDAEWGATGMVFWDRFQEIRITADRLGKRLWTLGLRRWNLRRWPKSFRALSLDFWASRAPRARDDYTVWRRRCGDTSLV